MESKLKHLAQLREEKMKLALHSDDLAAQLDASPLGEQLHGVNVQIGKLADDIENLTAEIKAGCVEIYKADPSQPKKPFAGVEIKVFTKLEYDPAKALQYAITNLDYHPELLQLNAKKFESLADKSELPFVKKVDDPRAQIAGNLDFWLEDK